jgi:hypothetical protein
MKYFDVMAKMGRRNILGAKWNRNECEDIIEYSKMAEYWGIARKFGFREHSRRP